MTTCIMFTLWPVCAAFSFLRQQAVHFEFRSVSLFRAVHPFWSGTSSSRAATNCVERSFSPARLPKVLHESFFGRVQAPRTRTGCIHTYALSAATGAPQTATFCRCAGPPWIGGTPVFCDVFGPLWIGGTPVWIGGTPGPLWIGGTPVWIGGTPPSGLGARPCG